MLHWWQHWFDLKLLQFLKKLRLFQMLLMLSQKPLPQ
jgi:hypothetical protein